MLGGPELGSELADGLGKSLLEVDAGRPSKFVLGLGWIDGVTAIMSGPVSDVADQRLGLSEDRENAADKIEVRERIPKGGESRVIDLKGPGKRNLKKIEFWYEAKGIRDEKADVTIVGMK